MTPQELEIAARGAKEKAIREAEDLAFIRNKGIITTAGGKHNLCTECYQAPCTCLPDNANCDPDSRAPVSNRGKEESMAYRERMARRLARGLARHGRTKASVALAGKCRLWATCDRETILVGYHGNGNPVVVQIKGEI